MKVYMRNVKIRLPLVISVSALFVSGCVPPRVGDYVSTHPTFRPSVGEANQVGPALNGYSQATVPKTGLIVVEGDDIVYGSEPSRHGRAGSPSPVRQSKKPFPEFLETLLSVRVENRGHPGDTLADGERRWAGRPAGNLLIISYGLADAKAKTPVGDFAASLDRMMSAAHAQGAAIMLLTPAAYADAKLSAAAEPYRQAMRDAQAKYGASLFALSTILASTSPHPTNGAFETDKGYKAIAYTIAPYIAVASPPKAPASSL